MKRIKSKTLSSVLLLVSVISSTQASGKTKQTGVELFAASVTGPEALASGSEPLTFLHDRPVLSPSSVELQNVDEKAMAIEFTVSKAEAKVMNRFLDKYPDKRLAFVYEGKLLFSPVIKTRLIAEGMRISFVDRAAFEHAVQMLSQSKDK